MYLHKKEAWNAERAKSESFSCSQHDLFLFSPEVQMIIMCMCYICLPVYYSLVLLFIFLTNIFMQK